MVTDAKMAAMVVAARTRHDCGPGDPTTWGAAMRGPALSGEIEGEDVGFLTPYLTYIQVVQIILGIALVISILLQARGAGLGSVFGGTGTVFKTRRGIDRLLFRMTVVFIVLFAVISFIGAAVPA